MEKKRIRVAGIIFIDGGIALMHRKNVKNRGYEEYYTFPGGQKEENETLEECVVREIKEELGIDVSTKELLYEYEGEKNKEYFYLCEYIGGVFGTGTGPEFSGNVEYKDSGEYIPEIIKNNRIKEKLLLPIQIKEKLLEKLKGNE